MYCLAFILDMARTNAITILSDNNVKMTWHEFHINLQDDFVFRMSNANTIQPMVCDLIKRQK